MIIYSAQLGLGVGRRNLLLLEGKAEGDLPSLTSNRWLALVLLALSGGRGEIRLGGPQGASLSRDLQQGLGVRGGLQAWPRREDGGRQPEGRSQAEGTDGRLGSGTLSFSDLAWAFLSFINLLVFHVSVRCLLSSGEKDVKLIPTLIKTVSRLNMYEHILIWGLNRKEN